MAMKKDQGKETTTEYRNGHRNPNSPRLTAFESNEEIEREIKDPPKRVKKKKATDEAADKKKKKRNPEKAMILMRINC